MSIANRDEVNPGEDVEWLHRNEHYTMNRQVSSMIDLTQPYCDEQIEGNTTHIYIVKWRILLLYMLSRSSICLIDLCTPLQLFSLFKFQVSTIRTHHFKIVWKISLNQLVYKV
jgi:hypothetical protein